MGHVIGPSSGIVLKENTSLSNAGDVTIMY